MSDDILSYTGDKKKIRDIFLELLLTGKEVSNKDVLAAFDKEFSTKNSLSKKYSNVKKVIPHVYHTLIDNGYLVNRKDGQTVTYQYLESDKDPLKKIKFKALLRNRYAKLEEHIKGKMACRFEYKPFDRSKKSLIFHPHIVKEYNGRLFSIGVSEMEGKAPFRKYVIAVDRIQGEILPADFGCAYLPPLDNEYRYLSNLVGVTLEEDAELTSITLRTHDRYTFGRLKTKPMHSTQRVVCWPSFEEGREYGDFELTVYPNNELVGQILSYGSLLEVVGPNSFRQRVAEELNKMSNRYGMVLSGENQ
jgi:hypothetical protein